MRIQSEDELLKPEVRKQIIEEIKGSESQHRKFEAYKKYQCYKDKTSHYVVDLLLQQLDHATVQEMRYSLSNVSIVRKVVDKLARVYSNGVERVVVDSEEDTKKIKKLEKVLDINSAMKKTNRFLKFQKNVDLFVKPCPEIEDGVTKWTVKLEALNPFLYDVIENYHDRTKAMCVVLSDYTPPATSLAAIDGKRSPVFSLPSPTPAQGNGFDEKIADTAVDQKMSPDGKPTFVFWSKKYHFTCNEMGEIIQDPTNPGNLNPLGVFNHISFAIDQDGAFWAEGGDDLIDGAILINALITHTNHVGVVQGYGQFYMTGENLPRGIKVGPTNAIIAEYKQGEQAEPKMGFLNANPQLDSLRGLIEMYIALYLTTNNLSTSGVATQLSGGQTLPSGVALIIDKAESLEDVQDQRQVFIDREPEIFEAINAVLKTYGDANLCEDLVGLELTEGFEENFVIRFNDPTPIMSEAEKLANYKLRQDLGIDSLISILMKDDPSLDEKQAEMKLQKIIEQRLIEKTLEQQAQQDAGISIVDPNAPVDQNGQPIQNGQPNQPPQNNQPQNDQVNPQQGAAQNGSPQNNGQ